MGLDTLALHEADICHARCLSTWLQDHHEEQPYNYADVILNTYATVHVDLINM